MEVVVFQLRGIKCLLSAECWRAQTRSNCSRHRAFISEGAQAWALRKYANRLMNIHTVQGKLEATGAAPCVAAQNARKKLYDDFGSILSDGNEWTGFLRLAQLRLTPWGSWVNLLQLLNPKSRPRARISFMSWINFWLSSFVHCAKYAPWFLGLCELCLQFLQCLHSLSNFSLAFNFWISHFYF